MMVSAFDPVNRCRRPSESGRHSCLALIPRRSGVVPLLFFSLLLVSLSKVMGSPVRGVVASGLPLFSFLVSSRIARLRRGVAARRSTERPPAMWFLDCPQPRILSPGKLHEGPSGEHGELIAPGFNRPAPSLLANNCSQAVVRWPDTHVSYGVSHLFGARMLLEGGGCVGCARQLAS